MSPYSGLVGPHLRPQGNAVSRDSINKATGTATKRAVRRGDVEG